MPVQFSRTTRSLAGESSRLSLVVWLAATALLAAWAAWFFRGSVTVYEVSQHARLEVQQAASPVAPQVSGRVAQAQLALGAIVKAGDVLVRLDDAAERKALDEARARLAGIGPRLAALGHEIDARTREREADAGASRATQETLRLKTREAALAADFASDYEHRFEELRKSGLISQVDARKAAADAARNAATRDSLGADASRVDMEARMRIGQHDAALASLAQQIAGLESEATTLRATIARLDVELDKRIVRAPVDGRLGDVVPTTPGSFVDEGQVMATIVPTGELMAIAEFPPSLTLGRIHEGQRGRIRLDGFPWGQYGTLPVTVVRVATDFRASGLRVELRIEPGTHDAPLQHGLPGTAEVAVEQASPAQLVLRAAGLLLSAPVRAEQATEGR